jgi:hypothetical protein
MSSMNQAIEEWVNIALDIAKDEIDSQTPEDTRELVGNNSKSEIYVNSKNIWWSIYNTTPYAKIVEYGVTWIPMNYHKPKWQVMYRWVGARMYSKARHDPDVTKRIKWSIAYHINLYIKSLNNGK